MTPAMFGLGVWSVHALALTHATAWLAFHDTRLASLFALEQEHVDQLPSLSAISLIVAVRGRNTYIYPRLC